jgi:hypothetical protein
MIAAKFNIGDRVEVTPNKEYGIITDIMFSNRCKVNLYEIVREYDRDDVIGTFVASDLLSAPKPRELSMDIKIDIAQNIVIATLYEEYGVIKTPLRRGHGHIIHDGELGIAQAASYACKRLYESLGGSCTKGGNQHDC